MLILSNTNSYYGGKGNSGVYQTIINQIPPHQVYIDCFLGKSAVMRYKKLAETSILIEKDPDIIEMWKSISLFGSEFIHQKTDGIHLLNTDGIQYLNQLLQGDAFKDKPDKVFIYCDPPFLMETRKDQCTRYKFEFTLADHTTFLDVATRLPFNVAISHNQNDLYDKYLKSWRKIEYQAQTRRGIATEILYMNYPEPEELHEYTYLGKDFRERERIRKKLKRHVEGLKRLPVYERNAILQAIFSSNTKNNDRVP